MDDLDLAQTLFVNEEGEIRSFPQHAHAETVQEARLEPRRWPLDASPSETVPLLTVVWRPVRGLPRPAQLAMARLYREREEAREIAIDWYWQYFLGGGGQFPMSEEFHALVRRCRDADWIKESEPRSRG